MKGLVIVVVLCSILLGVSLVSGQCSTTSDDFYIMNSGGVALRIDSTNDHVHVCNDVDLCNFIKEESSENEKPGVFTETSNSAYKTVPGSIYIAGTAPSSDQTYDGLAAEVNAPQTFLWYGSKAAFRAGNAPIGGNRNAWGAANIGLESAAFGYNTVANSLESFAAGSSSTASAFASTALGRLTQATGNGSLTFGFDSVTATAGNAPQIKADFVPRAPGNPTGSVESKSGPIASGLASFTTGISTVANTTAATAFGFGSIASGVASFTWGEQNEAFGASSTAWGQRSYASAKFATAFGTESEAEAANSLAFGFESIATASESVAAGNSANTYALQSFALGTYLTTSSHSSTVIGVCNVDYLAASPSESNPTPGSNPTTFPKTYPGRQSLSQDYVFMVGNGAYAFQGYKSGGCSYNGNALTVLKNGDLYVAGNIYYGVGPNAYMLSSTQKCRCLSADGSCDINSPTGNQCVPDDSYENNNAATFKSANKRDVTEDMEQMKSELESLREQIAQLTQLIKKN